MYRFFLSLLLIIGTVRSVAGQCHGIDIIVKSMDGKLCPLRNYINPHEGYVTLFVFWQTCCPTNLQMIDSLLELTDEYGNAEHLNVVLVSVDDVRTTSRVKPIVRMKGWKADVILDVNMELSRALSVTIPPQWVAFNHKGKPLYRRKIMDGETDVEFYFKELLSEISS